MDVSSYIRLRPLDSFAGTVDDLELEPDDRLIVPQVPQYVSMLGEVYNSTALLYEPGKTVANYLAKVGGIKQVVMQSWSICWVFISVATLIGVHTLIGGTRPTRRSACLTQASTR